ncbi:hypothetical protein D2M30_0313 [Bacillus amyloliquefaciens]|nr:hypothetical protein D2M30_0313 [Bacillus amyloliquefaciens]
MQNVITSFYYGIGTNERESTKYGSEIVIILIYRTGGNELV